MAISDWVLLAVMVLAAWYGWRLGTINVVAKIGAYILGYRLARTFSSLLASYILEVFPQATAKPGGEKANAFFSLFFSGGGGGAAHRLLEIVAFVIIFTLVCWMVRKIAYALTGVFSRGLLGQLNRALGALAAFLLGLAIIIIVADVVMPALERMGMGPGARHFFDSSLVVMPLLRNFQQVF